MIIDHIRDIKEFKHLFDTRPMDAGIFGYDFIIKNPCLYCFYDEKTGQLRGYISLYQDEKDRTMLCGASVRHNMSDNINAIIKVCNAYKQDIYADTDKKEAKICLLKAGFKKVSNNLYVRRHE